MAWKSKPPLSEETWRSLQLDRGKMKLLVDENLGQDVTRVLKESGWNATDVYEHGVHGKPDEAVFQLARKLDRVLLSHDTDFLDHRRFPLRQSPGVFILPGAEGDEAVLLRALGRTVAVAGKYRKARVQTKVHVRSDDTWTVFRLDAGGGVETSRYRFTRNDLEEWIDE